MEEETKRGRPTKYEDRYCDLVDEYLSIRQDEESEEGFYVKLPTIEGFALFLGVNKTTLYEWDKKYPNFSNSLTKLKTLQQERLIDKGLANKYNSTIAKLILSSNHGMRERSDITSDEKEIKSVNVNIVHGTQHQLNTDISEELPSDNESNS